MADQTHTLKCRTCGKERIVSRTMIYQYRRGIGLNCRSCGVSQGKKGKPQLWQRGAKHYKYNGGRLTRQRLMQQAEYIAWRDSVFLRDNYTCQICDQYSGYLHADHIKSWSEYEELRYDVENGRTLCVPCHYYVTFKRKMPEGTRWCNFTLTRKRG